MKKISSFAFKKLDDISNNKVGGGKKENIFLSIKKNDELNLSEIFDYLN